MKQPLFFSIILLMIFGSCSKKVSIEESADGGEIPVPALVTKKPYTSTHIFEAKLKHVEFYVCDAYTAQCPKTCGASGDYARFEVTRYQTFLVNGEGGKEQLPTFNLHLSNYYKIDYESNYVKFIRSLKKGDTVKFYVDYVYDPSQPVAFTDIQVLGFQKK